MISPSKKRTTNKVVKIDDEGNKCPHRQGLEEIHKRLEECIVHFESANDNYHEVNVHSYKMVMYELSDKIKNLITSK
tara:strand:+ start:1438 stop:1668 length:231 start_codon:yes stop_codon:yes gene_type:complete